MPKEDQFIPEDRVAKLFAKDDEDYDPDVELYMGEDEDDD